MWIKVISQIHSSCVLSLVVLSFAFLKTVTINPKMTKNTFNLLILTRLQAARISPQGDD